MKSLKYIVAIAGLMLLFSNSALAGPQDSIGTKVKNGKIFILHQVEKAQGLFSISRRYGVTLSEIIAANPGSDEVLHVDQILMIPTGKDAPMEDQVVVEYFSEDKTEIKTKTGSNGNRSKSTFARYHTVAKGETLYSISVLYSTKVDVIKNLNGLQTDVLSLGQQIMVPAEKEAKIKHDMDVIQAEKKLDDTQSKINEVREAVDPKKEKKSKVPVEAVTTDVYEISIEKMPKYKVEKITEKGNALRLEMTESPTNLRVCSHHLAEPGSTIMVTNVANKKSVFVKVVQVHELDKSVGDIILLSPTALADIELGDGGRVEVSFAR